MNRFLPIILIFALPAVVFAAKVEMPEWEETASAEEYKLGGGLWPTASKSTDGAVAKSDVAGGAETAEGSGETKGQAVKFYGPAGEVVEVTPSEEGEKQLPNPKADGNELLKFPDEEVAREV